MTKAYGWLYRLPIAAALAGGVLCAPTLVRAQEGEPEARVENRPVTLELEEADLYNAFRLLFKQAKVNYTLNPALRGTTVTVNIRQPFQRALETLIRASGQPITYEVEQGVYSVIPKKEEPLITASESEPEPVEAPKPPKIQRIRLNFTNSIDMAAMLGGRILNYADSYRFYSVNPLLGGMFGGFNQNGLGQGLNGMGNGQRGGAASGLLSGGVNPQAILGSDADARGILDGTGARR